MKSCDEDLRYIINFHINNKLSNYLSSSSFVSKECDNKA